MFSLTLPEHTVKDATHAQVKHMARMTTLYYQQCFYAKQLPCFMCATYSLYSALCPCLCGHLRVRYILFGHNRTGCVCIHVRCILPQEAQAVLQKVRRMKRCADLPPSHLFLVISCYFACKTPPFKSEWMCEEWLFDGFLICHVLHLQPSVARHMP